jgi:hypothetical protein
MPPRSTSRDSEETAAVVAHGLLTSMTVVSAGSRTLWEHWADLSPENRDALFERVLSHADIVSDGLRDLARGLPEDTLAEVDRTHRPQQ